MKEKEISLKEKLQNLIRERGRISYGEMCQFVAEEGYKISTAERRLRKSDSPMVKGIHAKSKRGTDYICAYEWFSPIKITIKADSAVKVIEAMANINGTRVPIFAPNKQEQPKLI